MISAYKALPPFQLNSHHLQEGLLNIQSEVASQPLSQQHKAFIAYLWCVCLLQQNTSSYGTRDFLSYSLLYP